MSEPSFRVVPCLSTPWQIALFVFRKKNDDPGYRMLEKRVLTIEESSSAIIRNSEGGLPAIDGDKIEKMLESNPLKFDYTEEDERHFKRAPILSEEEMRTLGMKRELLQEWKDFEDWYFSSRHSSWSTKG
jgi:hypothetical protein